MPKTCYKCSQTKDASEFYATHGNMCKVCAKAIIAENRRLRMADPEKHAARMAYNAAWWQAHPEQLKAKDRRRHMRHRDRRNAGRAQRYITWRQAYPEAYRAQNLRQRQQPGYLLYMLAYERARHRRDPERSKRYYHANLERSRLLLRAKNQRRRSRVHAAPRMDLSPEQWQEILHVFKYRCAYCGRRRSPLEQDHITPVLAQGSYTLHNIVPACVSCNRRKRTAGPPAPVQPLLLSVAPSRKP